LTTSKRREREKRTTSYEVRARETIARVQGSRFRSRDYYSTHIVDYFLDVLGLRLTPQQAELAEAIAIYDRVAGRSGRRTGKSAGDAGIGLWWYDCCDGRCIMTSATDRQVNSILWREVTLLRARAQWTIEGDIGVLARTGLRDGTGREIVGFTAREGEAMQGFAASARNPLLFIVDEASGVEQSVFDAIEGNRAGGGKVLLTGNPTRTSGEFFDAFHSKKRDLTKPDSVGYVTVHLSTEEASKHAIKGLATPEYIRERQIEWGEDSPLYIVHVKGEFAVAEDGRIFTLAMLGEAIERWATTDADGDITIGLDPAGPGGAGDESVLAVRQGKKILALQAKRGLSEDAHVAWAFGAARQYADAKVAVTIVLDRDGPAGFKVLNAFPQHILEQKLPMKLIPVRSSDRARRRPMDYERVRDELAWNLREWVRSGGALPDDPMLIAEMHAFSWEPQVTGKLKITGKDEVREELGRSPDRYDAVALCAWQRAAWVEDENTADDEETTASDDVHDVPSPYGDTPSPYG
jgi:hypothetical protein